MRAGNRLAVLNALFTISQEENKRQLLKTTSLLVFSNKDQLLMVLNLCSILLKCQRQIYVPAHHSQET